MTGERDLRPGDEDPSRQPPAGTAQPQRGIVRRLVDGELSVATLYWLVFFLPQVALGLLSTGISRITLALRDLLGNESPFVIFVSILAIAIVICLVALIGLLRIRRPASGWRWIAAGFVALGLVFNVYNLLQLFGVVALDEDTIARETAALRSQLPREIGDGVTMTDASYDDGWMIYDYSLAPGVAVPKSDALRERACNMFGDRAYAPVERVTYAFILAGRTRSDNDYTRADCSGAVPER